ncbi:MAG: hypothetical protein QXJ24_04970 [Thermoplasmatales archaeon]
MHTFIDSNSELKQYLRGTNTIYWKGISFWISFHYQMNKVGPSFPGILIISKRLVIIIKFMTSLPLLWIVAFVEISVYLIVSAGISPMFSSVLKPLFLSFTYLLLNSGVIATSYALTFPSAPYANS